MATRNKPANAVRADPSAGTPFDVRTMNITASVLFIVAGFAIVGYGLAWLMRLPLFTLAAVQVDGELSRNNGATIRANALPRLQGNFFTLDLAKAQAAFESVPWVRRATVRRIWPDKIAVTLEEHRVAAWWHQDEGENKLVNRQGEVFQANPGDVEDEGLATLDGPDEPSAAVMLAMLQRLQPALVELDARIDSLRLSPRGSWQIELDSGAEIELGRGDEAAVLARLQAFVATLAQVQSRFGNRALAAADLRHADGYALKLRGLGTVAPAAPASKNTN
ncbi:cell division protein FtsQ/DivIB [Rivibacter subsaxonicus]|uniref:Cell division protein FtsQ n=1 Tax=Rivibacter subsaxonicus TaxID=457575 RepID=A0A4Q7VG18_9BURK|nr:cell division protein FtsQ/DivIB [Rivibacter subsaxonicus]RZT94950.1 cell division protein FtsQ [Rivibacter subsaxonicus]